jgi:hypothetical protein
MFERMVKSKARCHFIQYMRNKPTKWGFKLWVLADMTGYTVDFNIYTGNSEERSESGLSHDVVVRLIDPLLAFQGYQLYINNFYSSPVLCDHLLGVGIAATGTFRTNRQGIPEEVSSMKAALEMKVPRGTGYYLRPPAFRIVYTCCSIHV